MLDAYTATNGVVAPRSSLVTGYDFLADAANAVKAEFAAGTGTTPDTLITPNGKSPQDPASWTATQLDTKLLGSRHDVIFLAGHFSANSALAADFTTSLLTTDLVASPVNLANAIVFSAGCHSGYNLVDDDAVPGVTQPLDWSQAFAQKRATLVAGTGYQYGDTDFLEYSERLYETSPGSSAPGTGRHPDRRGARQGQARPTSRRRPTSAASTRRRCSRRRCSACRCSASTCRPVAAAARAPRSPITPVPVATGPAATLGLGHQGHPHQPRP